MRRAAKAQLPLPMSVNTIAGPSAGSASFTRACRLSGPHPSLVSARSASPSTPEIASTDATSPSASDAWASTTPRTGSLIVFLQVLRRPRHAGLQPPVEERGGVVPGELEQVVHRHHLADHGDVLPRHQRHDDLGDGDRKS